MPALTKTILWLLLAGIPALAASGQSQHRNLSQGDSDQKRLGSPVWSTLAKVNYQTVEDQFGEMQVPVFSSEVKALEGKEITLPGYIIPADGLEGVFKPRHFILSSLPLYACFFCGTGGPESVVEVYTTGTIPYTTEPITVTGRLVLNHLDPYQLMYRLEDARLVK